MNFKNQLFPICLCWGISRSNFNLGVLYDTISAQAKTADKTEPFHMGGDIMKPSALTSMVGMVSTGLGFTPKHNFPTVADFVKAAESAEQNTEDAQNDEKGIAEARELLEKLSTCNKIEKLDRAPVLVFVHAEFTDESLNASGITAFRAKKMRHSALGASLENMEDWNLIYDVGASLLGFDRDAAEFGILFASRRDAAKFLRRTLQIRRQKSASLNWLYQSWLRWVSYVPRELYIAVSWSNGRDKPKHDFCYLSARHSPHFVPAEQYCTRKHGKPSDGKLRLGIDGYFHR